MKNDFLSDADLLNQTQIAARQEKAATLDLLRYLLQVDERRAYATLACSSLFEYVVRILGYSEMQASERVNSVRLMRAIPEVEAKIENGLLSMSTASQVQRFMRQEKKAGNEILPAEALEILNVCEHQSKREVEKTLFSLSSEEVKLSAEKIREVSEDFTELKFMITEATFQKLEEFKSLVGNDSLREIFDRGLDLLLAEVKKKKGISQTKSNVTMEVQKTTFPGKPETPEVQNSNDTDSKKFAASRFISIRVKRQIFNRSGGQCEFRNEKTKVRCQSRHQLQFDHFPIPFSRGGRSTFDNLRHLCFQHNQKTAMIDRLTVRTSARVH